MKKKLCLIFVLIFVIVYACQFSTIADNISTYNNNTSDTASSFSISSSGEAIVYINFMGYQGITTEGTINITIEKRNLLVFWNEVVTDTITVTGYMYDDELYYQLPESGTYRCTVEYIISGTGGADDVITFTDKASY